MLGRLFLVVVNFTLCVMGSADPTIYDCGSECHSPLMSSSDPTADSMPHSFPSSVPKVPHTLTRAMNSYSDQKQVHHEDALMVPHTNPLKKQAPIPESAQIPYEPFEEEPSLRRPCNLDQVVELLTTVANEHKAENERALRIHETQVLTSAPLISAKASFEEAERKVEALRAAKTANETLTTVLSTISIKTAMLEEFSKQMATFILEEGSLKSPIMKAIGRTNINLQSAVSAKQAALNGFAQHPTLSKVEIQQMLATYDQLILSIKKQLNELKLEASKVLTPVQLNLNQTDYSIERLKAEISALRVQQHQLEPTAEKFSSVALEGAEGVLKNALAHYNAEKEAQAIQIRSFDQAAQDRAAIILSINQIVALVSDIQQPLETPAQAAALQPPQSLAGSVPVVQSVSDDDLSAKA